MDTRWDLQLLSSGSKHGIDTYCAGVLLSWLRLLQSNARCADVDRADVVCVRVGVAGNNSPGKHTCSHNNLSVLNVRLRLLARVHWWLAAQDQLRQLHSRSQQSGVLTRIAAACVCADMRVRNVLLGRFLLAAGEGGGPQIPASIVVLAPGPAADSSLAAAVFCHSHTSMHLSVQLLFR